MQKNTIKDGVAVVVNELYRRSGAIRASELVEAARPVNSPAHDGFEWNDTVAGREYRLDQARRWIRRIEIRTVDGSVALFHVPVVQYADGAVADREGYYKPAAEIAHNPDEFEAAVAELRRRLRSAKFAYDELKAAARGLPDRRRPDFNIADRAFRDLESVVF